MLYIQKKSSNSADNLTLKKIYIMLHPRQTYENIILKLVFLVYELKETDYSSTIVKYKKNKS